MAYNQAKRQNTSILELLESVDLVPLIFYCYFDAFLKLRLLTGRKEPTEDVNMDNRNRTFLYDDKE